MATWSRRGFLGLAAGAGLAAGCGPDLRKLVGRELPEDLKPRGPIDAPLRLANRLGFGPRPGDLALIERVGQKAFVARQLAADAEEPLHLRMKLRSFEIDQFQPTDLEGWPEEYVIRQLQQRALLLAIYSPNQLRERMIDLWTNHFNVYARKGDAMYRVSKDQSEVIRKNALGSFPQMVKASAKSPAMLGYLDNTVNRKGVPNENYARELMELHTLGVDGGYTQRDVQEVARCFTGWTIENRFLRAKGQFRFDPDLHDEGKKTVLGHEIPAGGGIEDGERVLTILTTHPACARFVAGKIVRCFLGSEESPWRKRLADIYLKTGGRIDAMLRPLLESRDLLESPPVAKRPFDYVASLLRAVDADTDAGSAVQAYLDRMGQPLHQWPMPDGYPDQAAAWTGSLLARWNFALALLYGQVPGTKVDLEGIRDRTDVRSLIPTAKDLDGIDDDRDHLALAAMSPEFQWR